MDTYNKVKTAMLAIQRYPWEQGVCAQAMYETGETTAFIAMAHDAVLRQTDDGRLAVITDNIAVTDPASCGEAVLRAYEHTGNDFYKTAAEKMLDYLMKKAPRTADGLICHNDISFHENFSPFQIWADSLYMAPPFLAVMGEFDEAEKQIDGYLRCLTDEQTNMLFHIFDAGTSGFVRKKLWATGNGWALMGIARIISEAKANSRLGKKYTVILTKLLDSMLKYQDRTGMFRDILDDETAFLDATSAMMTAAVIYRGVNQNWLARKYLENADLVYKNVQAKINEYGIIQGVCGCPHFISEGTSAEAQAAYIMMDAWKSVNPLHTT